MRRRNTSTKTCWRRLVTVTIEQPVGNGHGHGGQGAASRWRTSRAQASAGAGGGTGAGWPARDGRPRRADPGGARCRRAGRGRTAWGQVVCEGPDQPLGLAAVAGESLHDGQLQRAGGAGGAHVGGEPVPFPGVAVSPRPPVDEVAVGVPGAAQGGADGLGSLLALAQGVGMPWPGEGPRSSSPAGCDRSTLSCSADRCSA
jgi:hypothetical protein